MKQSALEVCSEKGFHTAQVGSVRQCSILGIIGSQLYKQG